MTQRKIFLGVVVVLLGFGIAVWVASESPVAPERTAGLESKTPVAGPAVLGSPSAATASSVGSLASKFSALDPVERNAFLTEMGSRDLASIFQAMLDAGRVDHDRRQQLSIQTVLAYAMRRKIPDAGLIEKMRQFVNDTSNSNFERELLLGILSGARTKESVELLLQVTPALSDKGLKQVAIAGVRTVGGAWGDGIFHEELSPALEQTWRESRDSVLLTSVAVALAEVGAVKGIDLLLGSFMADKERDEVRARAAHGALIFATMLNPSAVPPLSAILTSQPPGSVGSKLASDTLARMPIPAAANALLNWLQTTDASTAALAYDYVVRSTSPAQLDAWNSALDPAVPFRSEKNREAIRAGLAEYRKNRGG